MVSAPQTCGGVRRWVGAGGGVEGPVQVAPELLLVLGVDQLKHTLVHHVGLRGGTQIIQKDE